MLMRFFVVLIFCGAAALATQNAFVEKEPTAPSAAGSCADRADGFYCLNDRVLHQCRGGDAKPLIACPESHACIETKDSGDAQCSL